VASPLDTTTEIETPEHVRFRHRVAGPARRALAYLVDALIRYAVLTAVVMAAALGGLLTGGALSSASMGLIMLVMFVLEWGYYTLLEVLMNGRTPGKALLRLRVVTTSGHPLNIADSMLRNLLRAADFLPSAYALGLAVMARDSRFRRLGDMVAGTMVVVEERHRVDAPLQLYPPATPFELSAMPDRPALGAEDLDAIELLLRRTGRLSRDREMELAEIVAPAYAQRLGIRPFGDPHRFLALLYHGARGNLEPVRS